MKLQGSGLFHPKTLQSQNCQLAENRLSLNGLEFVHGQLTSLRNELKKPSQQLSGTCPVVYDSFEPEPDDLPSDAHRPIWPILMGNGFLVKCAKKARHHVTLNIALPPLTQQMRQPNRVSASTLRCLFAVPSSYFSFLDRARQWCQRAYISVRYGPPKRGPS
jgi:hypothetical protein